MKWVQETRLGCRGILGRIVSIFAVEMEEDEEEALSNKREEGQTSEV